MPTIYRHDLTFANPEDAGCIRRLGSSCESVLRSIAASAGKTYMKDFPPANDTDSDDGMVWMEDGVRIYVTHMHIIDEILVAAEKHNWPAFKLWMVPVGDGTGWDLKVAAGGQVNSEECYDVCWDRDPVLVPTEAQ